ncbi:MAG: ABC transporter ATP-binding protein [Halobacteriales archaeon]
MARTADPEDDAVTTASAADAGARPPAVAVEGLRKVYGSGEDTVTAVGGVDFEIEPGTAVGLLGPNGAGKTTTIKSLLGLVVPTEGRARVAGVDVAERPAEAYRHVGAMLEGARNTYWRLTVRENLQFFAALSGQRPSTVRERHDELLERFDLAGKADTAVRELSRGMQQKVSLASTLAREAEVAFLDEPTLGLDVESSLELRRELRRLVEDEGLTVVVSSHDMDVIEHVCDRVVIMSEGEVIADDRVEELLDLFHTQTYEVTVESGLSPGVRDHLGAEYGAEAFEAVSDRERFAVSVTGNEFYALIEDMRAAGLTVHEFDAVEPDLEDVFLDLTSETDVAASLDGGNR